MSGNNIYFIPAPNTCGNGCISAYNIQTIGSFGVKPLPGNDHAAAIDLIGIKSAIHYRFACSKHGMAGIDKAAIIHNDSIGVGNNNTGSVTGNFNKSVDAAGIGACYFVEDDFGRTQP